MINYVLAISLLLFCTSLRAQQKDLFSWDETATSSMSEHLHNSERKILWWNVGCNIIDKKIHDQTKKRPLSANLETLARSKTPPQILILGEYCPQSMVKKTLTALNSAYPYRYHLEKSNPYKPVKNGIVVFSKNPIQLEKKSLMEVGVNQKENLNSARHYLLLKVSDPQGAFYLSPVHFYNPWGKMSLPELLIAATGTSNLNYKQAEEHLNYLSADLKDKSLPLIVIGDFNSAKNIGWSLNMATYNLFSKAFTDIGSSATTYPTSSALQFGNKYSGITIDHAFAHIFKGLRASTPTLQGSDHYPILISF